MPRGRAITTLCAIFVLCWCAPALAAGNVENSSENLRTGWYPDEGSISPQLVSGGTWGQLWSADVEGNVYAQPLLEDGTLLVVTEENKVYGLDPATGEQKWSKPLSLGNPWNPADIGCGDLTPYIGVTGTPVIDPSTNIAYFTHKTYVSGKSGPARWYMDAVSMATGTEQPGFPVELSGTAQNSSSKTFFATDQLQRPGLLLMEGEVYAAFGSDCDHEPYQGWIFGVSTSGQVKARWVTDETAEGAGIWQSGSGIFSDGPGTLMVSTGNGGAPDKPTPGNQPPANCGECIIRLNVQPDGSLKAVDFFAPYDALTLDQNDADFASGGITGLPSEYFGTSSIPHLAVVVGKEGNVYLLDRDNLGGYQQGPSGSDEVVQRIGPRGGVWSRPGVWPGDGGWIYIPTSSGNENGGNLDMYKYGVSGSGAPTLSLQGTSTDAFGWGSSATVITSEGTTSGSALVWTVWMANREGNGGELRAYNPVPVEGHPVLRWSSPVGTASTYATPGVGAGRLYVGNREGKVMAFGSPVTAPLTGPSLAFGATNIGTTAEKTITLTATEPLTVTGLSSASSQFKVGGSAPALPATLATGQSISVPITFAPTESGVVGSALTAVTSSGRSTQFSLTGTGQTSGPQLQISPRNVLSFGGTQVGGHLSGTVTISNLGGGPLTIGNVKAPGAPFSATGLPAPGSRLEPGASINVTVSFEPTQGGLFESTLGVESNGGNESVVLTGNAGSAGALTVEPESVSFGSVAVGETVDKSFTLTNTGGTAVTVTKSKPPSGGEFTALTSLPEGTTIKPGESVIEEVAFTPTASGYAAGTFQINGDDITGLHQVQFTGTGTVPQPASSTWTTNGTATISGGRTWLTAASPFSAGSVFFDHPLNSAHLSVTFKSKIGGGSGGSGLALMLADPAEGATPDSLGTDEAGLGFSGIPGIAVALQTEKSAGAPSANFVGVSDGGVVGTPQWLATSTNVPSLRATRTVTLEVNEGTLTVIVEKQTVLTTAVSLPGQVLLGFTGATGALTDAHSVGAVSVTGPAAPPAAKLKISNSVLAPKGSTELKAAMVMSGSCPTIFTTAALAGKKGVSPKLNGASEGTTCSVREAEPAAEGGTWTTTASINGGAPEKLSALSGQLTVPAFALKTGTNTLKFTNEWIPPQPVNVPDPSAGGWQINGSAAIEGDELVLTPVATGQSGSAFYPSLIDPQNLTVEFTESIAGGTGADGMALAFANGAEGAEPNSLGVAGGGLGFSGIPGVAVALDEYKNDVNPSNDFVGLTEGPLAGGRGDEMDWLATYNLAVPLQDATHRVKVVTNEGTLTVSIDGTQALSQAITVPASAYLGFTAGTGGLDNRHAVSDLLVSSG